MHTLQYMNDINDYHHKSHIFDDTADNIEWKELAVEQTVEKLMAEMIEDSKVLQNTNVGGEDLYESESDDSYMKDACSSAAEATMTETARSLPYTKETIVRFIDALRYNLIFNVGFDVMGIHPDDEKSCLCPCCKNMIKWRQNFNVEFMTDKDSCQGFHKLTTPKGLMDHLNKLGTQGGYLHRGVELYLIEMYV